MPDTGLRSLFRVDEGMEWTKEEVYEEAAWLAMCRLDRPASPELLMHIRQFMERDTTCQTIMLNALKGKIITDEG